MSEDDRLRVKGIQKSFLFVNSEFTNFGCFQLGGLMCGEMTTVMHTWAKEVCLKSPENNEILDGTYWPWILPPVYVCMHFELYIPVPYMQLPLCTAGGLFSSCQMCPWDQMFCVFKISCSSTMYRWIHWCVLKRAQQYRRWNLLLLHY